MVDQLVELGPVVPPVAQILSVFEAFNRRAGGLRAVASGLRAASRPK